MLKKTLVAAALAAITGSAFAAAPVANIKIDGRVTPPTCTINGAEQGDLKADFGAISPAQLAAQGTSTENYIELGVQVVPLTVSCDAKTYLSFRPVDTYAGRTVGLENRSALVAVKDNTIDIGHSFFHVKNMTVDGKTAYLGRESSAYGAGNPTLTVPGVRHAWTSEAQENVAATTFKFVAGNIFAGNLEVTARLYSAEKLRAQKLDLTEQIDYIGENVLAFNFGI